MELKVCNLKWLPISFYQLKNNIYKKNIFFTVIFQSRCQEIFIWAFPLTRYFPEFITESVPI